MDSELFMVALVLFAGLYIGLAVYLLWSLAITTLFIFVYLAARYKHVAENYPYNIYDSVRTVAFIATTWTIFVIVGPQPIPFVGNSLSWNPASGSHFASIVAAVVIFMIVMFAIFAIILPRYEGRGGTAGGSGEGGNIAAGSGG